MGSLQNRNVEQIQWKIETSRNSEQPKTKQEKLH